MQFIYDQIKATQTAAYFIAQAGGTKNYTSVIKMVYLADRKSLLAAGSPITGAYPAAMPNGMVPSEVLDDLKTARDGTYWRQHIGFPVGYDVSLTALAAPSHLSLQEVSVLEGIQEEFGSKTWQELVEFTHSLPEYQDPGTSSIKIDPEDILRKSGVQEKHIHEIGAHADMQRMLKGIAS